MTKGAERVLNYGEPGWSRHNDMADALEAYRKGDKQAFKKCGQEHRSKAQAGHEVTNDDWSVRQFEDDHMLDLAMKAKLLRGVVKPTVEHRVVRPAPHWTDIYFSKRNPPPEDLES